MYMQACAFKPPTPPSYTSTRYHPKYQDFYKCNSHNLPPILLQDTAQNSRFSQNLIKRYICISHTLQGTTAFKR